MKPKFLAKKNIVLFLGIFLLSASCSLFSKPVTAGVFKTVNGGADWQFSSKMKDVNAGNLSVSNIAKLGFDPQNHEIVYAGSFNSGLYKSVDAGQTWARILSKILVYDFAINPFDPKVIYTAGSLGASGKVLKTTDGGASWQEIYNEGSAETLIRSIAINPISPNQIIVGTNAGNIVRSFDGGISWKLSKNLKSPIKQIVWQGGQIFVLSANKGIFRTEDTLDDYVDITTTITNPVSIGSFSYSSGGSFAFTQFYIDPISSNLMYLTSDSGLFKTGDSGKTWQKISLPVQDVKNNRAITISKNNSNVVFTSVGNTIFKSVDAGTSWQTQSIASSGFVQYILVDSQLPQVVYLGTYVLSD